MKRLVLGLQLSLIVAITTQAVAQESWGGYPLKLSEPEAVGMSAEKVAAAENLFVEAVANGKVLGYQLLVARRGGIVLHSAGGVRDVANDLPMTTESLLDIASMTKSVVAVGLLKLVDEGRLSLDDHVAKYLPGFEMPPSNKITIRQLLLHKAGFMRFESFHGGLTPNSADVPNAPSLKVDATEAGRFGPEVEPGTIFRYNNMGYNIAGAIIEEVSGLKLDEYLRRTIYEPLGMSDTHHDTWNLDQDRISVKYWFRNGEWEVMGGTPPPIARANAGMISNAWDFAKFCQVLLDKGAFSGGMLLKPETLELATSPIIEVSEAYLSVEVESEMGLESEWYEYRDARDLNIDRWRGLGFVVSDTGVFSHAGIYGTFFYVDPARELVGIILTQSIYGGNPGQAFIEAISEAVID
jgi:CubicO group peptidase (beta-lactamase class C family)